MPSAMASAQKVWDATNFKPSAVIFVAMGVVTRSRRTARNRSSLFGRRPRSERPATRNVRAGRGAFASGCSIDGGGAVLVSAPSMAPILHPDGGKRLAGIGTSTACILHSRLPSRDACRLSCPLDELVPALEHGGRHRVVRHRSWAIRIGAERL